MAFQQLYYTSCERGLSGFAGFQFNAVTPGISPAVMAEVEQLTVYEPPLHLTAGSGRYEHSDYPVNLLHARIEGTGSIIIARVAFVGEDFSQRWGNYFAHTLMTHDPHSDLANRLPIELWEAPFWRSKPHDEPELPLLPGPPQRGHLSRLSVTDFMGSQPHLHLLPLLLSAAQEAISGGPHSVLLVGPDSTTIAHWIGALSYLLGDGLARRMTFSTYHRNPDYCPTHIVGAVAPTASSATVSATRFRLFNVAEGQTAATAEVAVHPAAPLLVRTGIEASARLWRRARMLAARLDRAPDSLEDWFPPLATAAMLLDERLDPVELDAAVSWCSDPNTWAAAGADDLVDKLLSQPLECLPPERQRQLIELMDDGGQRHRIEEVELSLVRGAMAQSGSGTAPGQLTRLTSPLSRRMAAHTVSERLRTADAVTAVDLLAWAGAASAPVSGEIIESCTRRTIADAILSGHRLANLGDAVRAWPEVRGALLDRFQPCTPAEQLDAVRMLPLQAFHDQDLDRHPELGERWLLDAADRDELTAATALSRVLRLRRVSRHEPIVDEELLHRLWSKGEWSSADAIDVLDDVPREELRNGVLLHWLLRTMTRPPDLGVGGREWVRFLQMLVNSTAPPLPHEFLHRATRLLHLSQRLYNAARAQTLPPELFLDFYELYESGSSEERYVIARWLPFAMARAHPYAAQLGECPWPVFQAFCADALARLSTDEPDSNLAGWLFVAMRDLIQRDPRKSNLLDNVLARTLATWGYRDARTAKAAANTYARNQGRPLDLWLKQHRSGPGDSLLRKIRPK
ncbi:GTPase-associated protein 1-related protein [Actinomadura sp. HBU206391]|uniref:GTPase-associated protein 1-related protein n=1 Tax=Actinomadura sp. HBU206391 TaxID=2731692 RepID=UPI00164F4D42|nr:GTPase-associated protein 1-related protein [Actinomadura sp. HBU206391]MBC6460749.1 hypothetical protein [Actinomadura sp. HBU206391]